MFVREWCCSCTHIWLNQLLHSFLFKIMTSNFQWMYSTGLRETKEVVSELFFELVPWFYHLSHSNGLYCFPYRSVCSGCETNRKSLMLERFWTYSQVLICRGKICFLADYAPSPLHSQLLFLCAGNFFHTVYRVVVALPTVGYSWHFKWLLDHRVCCELPVTSWGIWLARYIWRALQSWNPSWTAVHTPEYVSLLLTLVPLLCF